MNWYFNDVIWETFEDFLKYRDDKKYLQVSLFHSSTYYLLLYLIFIVSNFCSHVEALLWRYEIQYTF